MRNLEIRGGIASGLLFIAFVTTPLWNVSCVKHVATLTSAQNIQLSVDQALDVIAHSNQAAEKGAIQLAQAKVITFEQARPIVNYTGEVAAIVQKALAANQTGDAATRTTALLEALNQVTQLPPEVKAFINGPQTAEITTLVGLIQSSVSIAQGLIAKNPTPAAVPAAIKK